MKTLLLISIMFYYVAIVSAQWQPTNGPVGGFVRHFIFDSTSV